MLCLVGQDKLHLEGKNYRKLDWPKIQLMLKNKERELVTQLIKSENQVDLIIPRGGKSLIKVIADNSMFPVLKHY